MFGVHEHMDALDLDLGVFLTWLYFYFSIS